MRGPELGMQSFPLDLRSDLPNWVVPAAMCREKRIGLFRPPATLRIKLNRMVRIEYGVNYRPGRFDGILAGEKCSVSCHGITQQSLVGCLLPCLFIQQEEFTLVANELLAGPFDARSQGNSRIGRKPEAKIVGSTFRRCRIVEQSLWRRLQFHQHFGGRGG